MEHTHTQTHIDGTLVIVPRRFYGLLFLSLSLARCSCKITLHTYAMLCYALCRSNSYYSCMLLCILFYNCRILHWIRMQRSRAQHSTLRTFIVSTFIWYVDIFIGIWLLLPLLLVVVVLEWLFRIIFSFFFRFLFLFRSLFFFFSSHFNSHFGQVEICRKRPTQINSHPKLVCMWS